MNMKKSLIALAVAGAFAAPAFAATSNVDVYGIINASWDRISSDAPGQDTLYRVSNNSSRIGFKGAEDLGGGMKAVWQIEEGVNVDSAAGAFGGQNQRNTFLGLNGGFGTVLMGAHDTPYKLGTGSLDPFADTIGDYNNIIGNVNGTSGFDLRVGNVLAYISPTVSGFHAAIAKSFQNEAGNLGATNPDALTATGIYSNGPLFASLSWEEHKNLAALTPGAAGTKQTGTKLGLGYTFGDTKVGFIWEKLSDKGAATAVDRNAWSINATHQMGPIALKAAYSKAGDGDSAAKTSAKNYALGADYSLSKRTTAYAVYTKTTNDAGSTYGVGAGQGSAYTPGAGLDPSGFALGMKHSF